MEQFPVGSSMPYKQTDVNSIATQLSGQWAYSPSFVKSKLIAQTSIKLTGSRRADYLAAEKNTGKKHKARTTVWHHVYDFNQTSGFCTMQLVAWNDHVETVPHAGGCKAFAAFRGRPYRQLPPDKEAPAAALNIPSYSAKELDDFSVRTGLTLPSGIRRFYNGEFRLNQTALNYAAQKDFYLDAVLPLWDQEGASVEGIHQLVKNHPAFSQLKGITTIGVDACGNLFGTNEYGALLFYDHEEDDCIYADLALKDLMEV